MKKKLGIIRKIKKKHIFLALLAVIVLGGLAKAYSAWVGTTRIAFLNYQAIALGQISHANDNAMIKLSEITTDDFDHLDDYDMIIVNGMGLRIDENQRKQLEEASYKVPTLTHAATNPANNIVSVDNFDADYLMQYIENGGKKNYHSMLAYIRKFIDGKKFMAPEPERVNERPDYLLTHFDPKDEKGDELGFNSIREYNAFLAKNGLYKKGAPTIMLTGFMGAAPDMEKAFEKKGFMVYRINKLQSFIAGHHADSIQANAVVNMAHGRLGDYFVEFMKQKNIPLFSPLNINRLTTEWESDKQGMNGGFMSQSIVTPEIDGAIRPYVVFGQRINKEGLQRRRQRLPCPVGGGRGHRHLHRRGYRPGDRRHHRFLGRSLCAGNAASTQSGTNGAHPRQLPVYRGLQPDADCTGCGGGTAAHHLGAAAQRVHPGHQPAEYDRPAGQGRKYPKINKQAREQRGGKVLLCSLQTLWGEYIAITANPACTNQ